MVVTMVIAVVVVLLTVVAKCSVVAVIRAEDAVDVLCDVVVDFEVLELLAEAKLDVGTLWGSLGIMVLTFRSISRALTAAEWLLTVNSIDVPGTS